MGSRLLLCCVLCCLPQLVFAGAVYEDPEVYAEAAAQVGVDAQTLLDFEDLSAGASLTDKYAGLGLALSSPGTLTAETDVHGSAPRGTLAVRVNGDTPQSVTLLFDIDQRALSLYLLDTFYPVTVQAYDSAGNVDAIIIADAIVEDTAGGTFRGMVFDLAVTRVVITGESGDGIGFDDLSFSSTDWDGDGYGPGTGHRGEDCDDGDPTVYPGATEVLDGKDQDCDGLVDNAYAVISSESDFSQAVTDAGLGFMTVLEVDDVTLEDPLENAYQGLGIYLGASDSTGTVSLFATADVCGSEPNGALAAVVDSADHASFSWFFTEPQTLLATRLLDLNDSGLTVDAYDDGGLVNTYHLDAAAEDTPRGLFRGFSFAIPVTRVVFTSTDANDCIGFDDLQFVSLDTDGDGYGTASGRWGDDCDDTDPTIYPGAVEVVDGRDGDCDGLIDNAYTVYTSPSSFEIDGENDGVFGFARVDFEALAEGEIVADQYLDLGIRFSSDGGISASDDVYDSHARGSRAAKVDAQPAIWTWDFVEPQHYIGGYFLDVAESVVVMAYLEGTLVNDVLISVPGEDTPGGFFRGLKFSSPVDSLVMYGTTTTDGLGFDDLLFDPIDDDGDGFGVDDGDCDNFNDAVYPGATEFCNAIDDNCDGTIDEGFDLDGDGVTSCAGDCDESDDQVGAGLEELCDGKDNNCDGSIDEGFDADGDGFPSCMDCDDGSSSIHPEATEVCNGVDDNCDGATDEGFDQDGDGFVSCALEDADADCDDQSAASFPGADEIPYNGVDEDCDGADLTDVDGDGHEAQVVGGDDCDDEDSSRYTGADEVPYDGIDQDCDGEDLTDVDGDGFIADTVGGDDCNDEDLETHPGAAETPYDGVDQDCDGEDLTDVDGDGVEAAIIGGVDCNDEDLETYPGAQETPYDGVDQDCDGEDLTDVDGDGYAGGGLEPVDCDDSSPEINPGTAELCGNDVDENCDGLAEDCLSPDPTPDADTPADQSPTPVEDGTPEEVSPTPFDDGTPAEVSPTPFEDGTPAEVSPTPFDDGTPEEVSPTPLEDGTPAEASPTPFDDGTPEEVSPPPEDQTTPTSEETPTDEATLPPAPDDGGSETPPPPSSDDDEVGAGCNCNTDPGHRGSQGVPAFLMVGLFLWLGRRRARS